MGGLWDAIREFLGAVVSFFYSLVPNLGVAIILLTVAVGVVLFPLTLKQTRSMRAMQVLQPELKRLQKEYAGDKPALQQATLALYKERGVNPAAGCLPLLLQMPIWFALFQVLQSFSASPTVLNDDCAGRQPLVAVGGEFSCTYQGFVPPGEDPRWNMVTAKLSSPGLASAVERSDAAGVAPGEVLPLATISVRPDPGLVPVGGGTVQFAVRVVNGGAEAVTLVGLTDDVYGDLLAEGNASAAENTCPSADRAIGAGLAFECSFRGQVAGGSAATRSTNTVTAALRDGAGAEAVRVDRALVDIGDVLPFVTVALEPQSGSAPASGGLVEFKVTVRNEGQQEVTVNELTDDVYKSLTSPGGSPTRFLKLVPNQRLNHDIQAWLDAGNQPADPAWRDFAWMNLSISPQAALGRGFVAFLPYLMTLLLVMGTAYYQQRQTMPKPQEGQAAPKQPGQAVLKIFPVLFGFISYTLPAGLAVYFAASSVFRIGQQSLIIRMGERQGDAGKPKEEPAEAVAEPEVKAVKAPERPARTTATPPRSTGATASTRSPQASQQRGKKRRRR